MGLPLLMISCIVAWIASLIGIVLFPTSTSFLSDGKPRVRKNILLVIAHPDDESMFFTPTINYLISERHALHILCLSIGNADGMGNVRKNELYRACAVLKVPLDQVKIIDSPDLQDGFGRTWDHSLLSNIISKYISNLNIDVIITFDTYGVSGHCNHSDVHFGVREFLRVSGSQISIEAWELESIKLLRKYSGPIDVWCSKLVHMFDRSKEMHCVQNNDTLRSFRAMAEHSSQWLWFRKLFMSFSSYTYVNNLRRI